MSIFPSWTFIQNAPCKVEMTDYRSSCCFFLRKKMRHFRAAFIVRSRSKSYDYNSRFIVNRWISQIAPEDVQNLDIKLFLGQTDNASKLIYKVIFLDVCIRFIRMHRCWKLSFIASILQSIFLRLFLTY